MDHDLAHALAAASFALSDLARSLDGHGVPIPAEITPAAANLRQWLQGVSG
jgi:hypothetical protein